MKIAIGMCGKTSGKCSTMGCFRAYNGRTKHFRQYENKETELIAFFSCKLCFEEGEEKLKKIGTRLKNKDVDRLHLGNCAVKCKEDRLVDIKRVLANLDIELVEGTH